MATYLPVVQFLLSGVFDATGAPVALGQVYSYNAGTDIPRDLYVDALGVTPSPNPTILDTYGRAVVYGSGDYKLTILDVDGNPVFIVDDFAMDLSIIAHDTTHEDGGEDRVTPILHATRHEAVGADIIDYPLPSHATTHGTGGCDTVIPPLHAVSHQEAGADPVVPIYHHTRHEAGGVDELQNIFDWTFVWKATRTQIIQKITAFSADWEDRDISAYTGADTARAAIIIGYMYGNGTIPDSSYMHMQCLFRKKGGHASANLQHIARRDGNYSSSQEIIRDSQMFFVPVDGLQIFQFKFTNVTGGTAAPAYGYYGYLVGYLK